MALPFAKQKRNQLVSVDLGGRTTKAVHMQRKGDGYELLNYAVMDAPIYQKTLSAELLGEHLKAVLRALDAKTKSVTLALGVNESIVRHAELPQMPVSDMRMVLKNNSKNYLQQDLPRHVFDCFIVPPSASGTDKGKPAQTTPKFRVLVAGARQQLVDDLQTAAKAAGLMPDHLVPGLIGPVNAFELAMPEVFAKEVVALVDVGFRHSTISILQQGELALTRVVAIGGDRMTSGLADALGISYAEAEGIKIGMPAEVQTSLDGLIIPLGRELRASLDFFEHQSDRVVSQVYLSGGSSQSEYIVNLLQGELGVECKAWNPVAAVHNSVPPDKLAEMDQVGPHLAVAIGAGISTYL